MKKTIAFLFLSASLLSVSSCSKFNKVMKNPDPEARYDAAVHYYETGDYHRAGLILEELIPVIIGSAKAEKVQFYYAYCHYHQLQYQMSAHYFKSFYDTYRRSTYAEEALYMHAFSLFKNTPVYHLDQSGTNEAINALQEFINRYPNSSFAQECAKNIQSLRERLETKSYEIAKRYHRLRRFKASVIAYDNFMKDFPDSHYREEVAFLKMKAQYELASISIYSLKKERLDKTLEDYYYFLDKFGTSSSYLKSAESIYESCQRELKTINI